MLQFDFVSSNFFKNFLLRIYGAWNFSRPMFIICDAELVKHTMIKYFDNFVNHDDVMSKVCDGIFAKSVLLLESDEWREMRNKL